MLTGDSKPDASSFFEGVYDDKRVPTFIVFSYTGKTAMLEGTPTSFNFIKLPPVRIIKDAGENMTPRPLRLHLKADEAAALLPIRYRDGVEKRSHGDHPHLHVCAGDTHICRYLFLFVICVNYLSPSFKPNHPSVVLQRIPAVVQVT